MRARRSCLSVPARPAGKLEKGPELAADEIVLDLEDSVPPALKEEARAAVADALAEAEWLAPTVSVRVNAVGTPWFEDDLRALAGHGRLATVIVPKVEGPADLEACGQVLEAAEPATGGAEPVGIQALIESAAGLRAVDEIAEASPRLEALVLGLLDMSVSLGFPDPAEGPRWDYVRGAMVAAARAAGIQAIDGPFAQISDLDGLVASAARSREFGFDGRWALHPAQVEPLNLAFSPTPEQLERAEAILAALESSSDGAVMLDGEMIDEASRKRAEQVLATGRSARLG
jgi:citrate lyase subunit beta / citryl-CoA lyase